MSSLRAGGCFTMQDLADNGFDEEIYVARLKPNKSYLAGFIYSARKKGLFVSSKNIFILIIVL